MLDGDDFTVRETNLRPVKDLFHDEVVVLDLVIGDFHIFGAFLFDKERIFPGHHLIELDEGLFPIGEHHGRTAGTFTARYMVAKVETCDIGSRYLPRGKPVFLGLCQ